jgi:hypothetical protein
MPPSLTKPQLKQLRQSLVSVQGVPGPPVPGPAGVLVLPAEQVPPEHEPPEAHRSYGPQLCPVGTGAAQLPLQEFAPAGRQ